MSGAHTLVEMRRLLLFDRILGVVAVAGYDGIFERLLLFVLHLQRLALVVYKQYLNVAVGAVVLVVGGLVGEDVLVADGVVDGGEDVGQLALEHGVEVEAAGHLGEGLELVLGLKRVDVAKAAASESAASA